jgi:hypothetical protein
VTAATPNVLRRHIQIGLDDFARGDSVEVDAESPERLFAELTLGHEDTFELT